MGGKKREYDDDDGRTIVDMSQVSRPHLYTAPRPQNEFPKSEKKAPGGRYQKTVPGRIRP